MEFYVKRQYGYSHETAKHTSIYLFFEFLTLIGIKKHIHFLPLPCCMYATESRYSTYTFYIYIIYTNNYDQYTQTCHSSQRTPCMVRCRATAGLLSVVVLPCGRPFLCSGRLCYIGRRSGCRTGALWHAVGFLFASVRALVCNAYRSTLLASKTQYGCLLSPAHTPCGDTLPDMVRPVLSHTVVYGSSGHGQQRGV